MEEKMNQIFVGKKYEKFKKKVFSIPAFLFGSIYFAYRKMPLLALGLLFLETLVYTLIANFINLGIELLSMLCIRILLGLYFPIVYRKFYNTMVKKIILENIEKPEVICIDAIQKKGGTNITFIFVFIIINIILSNIFNSFVDSKYKNLNFSNDLNSNTSSNNSNTNDENYKLLENIKVAGWIGSTNSLTLYINDESFLCSAINPDILCLTNFYEELSANIYYVEDNSNKTIVKYELYNTITNTKLENIKNENSLRQLLGYHIEGNYEETLTLVKNGTYLKAWLNNKPYIYSNNIIFKTENGKTLIFRYETFDITHNQLNSLQENQKYNVKFNVNKSIHEFEYTIIDISPLT